MPCRTYDDTSAPCSSCAQLKKEVNKITAMLCSLCANLEREFDVVKAKKYIPKHIQEWWEDHKKHDLNRIALEELRAKREAMNCDMQIEIARLESECPNNAEPKYPDWTSDPMGG